MFFSFFCEYFIYISWIYSLYFNKLDSSVK
ncbi:hypothetical protein KL86PLE_100276 [uncultured Pleomorphomonas sp.]|uniref:Uncharacterized protein n=1 Tax=uncultured Pleomorphomonas sp. TaxID=442121 RepID=A0A212L232_9HYPH|nr:hypothetical protein KL86PLE_100276 [uncultured Pleomorphomonas sp.]